MNDKIGPRISHNIMAVVLVFVFCNAIGQAVEAPKVKGNLQADQQGQQKSSPNPDPAKESQKAADEAKTSAAEAKKAADEAKSAQSSATSAAGSAQSALARTNKSKDNATDAAQKANSAAGASLAAAQTASKKAQQAIAAAGIALNGSTNVKDNVSIQVVLLPRQQAERVFSKEIARHYAVVQVTINNQSKDAAFVLQSIFVDYSQWALSGMSPTREGVCDDVQSKSQAISCPGQVASVESRVIRGELQDAATWTWRNGFIRAAVLVGTVASGIPAFGSKNALKYVGAYNGQFVPGVQVLWPDATVPQLNRVSDLGFQTNKVIAKENSDIVYAFFPIDRFLTPGIRNIFLNAPAVFFAPAQIFVDPHVGDKHCRMPGVCLPQSDVNQVKDLIEDLAYKLIATKCQGDQERSGFCKSGAKEGAKENPKETPKERDENMLALLTLNCPTQPVQKRDRPGQGDVQASGDAQSAEEDKQLLSDCQIAHPVQELIERISLNSIDVLVHGIMTVDVKMVPASIAEVVFDKGNNSPDVWQTTGTPLDATINGRFLTGAIPNVTSIEAPAGKSSNIADYIDPKTISVVPDESNDVRLRFKLQWKTTIPQGSKLHFQVTKFDSKDTKKTPVESMEFILPVNYVPKAESK